jgi:preprotein translocase subunit SecF
MDFRQSTRNKKLEHWVLVILVFSLCVGLNFFVSKINWQIDLSAETKYSLSEESIALLNKIEAPIEIIVTIKDDKNLP